MRAWVHVLNTRPAAFRCFTWRNHRPVRYALVIVSVTVPPAASAAVVRSERRQRGECSHPCGRAQRMTMHTALLASD